MAAKLYWRYKKNGKWTWKPADPQNWTWQVPEGEDIHLVDMSSPVLEEE